MVEDAIGDHMEKAYSIDGLMNAMSAFIVCSGLYGDVNVCAVCEGWITNCYTNCVKTSQPQQWGLN